MKYRKKPVVIEAEQYDSFISSKTPFLAKAMCDKAHDGIMGEPHIHTLEGTHNVSHGDWIIKGVKGEFYPIKNDIFLETYEPVVEKEIKKCDVVCANCHRIRTFNRLYPCKPDIFEMTYEKVEEV
jgi:hypothetical protein